MIKKKRKKIKDIFNESIFAEADFYIKLVFTIFFLAIYLLIFFYCDGVVFFEPAKYANAFNSQPFQVHVIDVENGDAILMKLPDNKTLMIDTGDERYYRNVSSYLKQYYHYEKCNCIDYLVLTHADSDHIGSAAKIIKNFNVKRVYRPKIYSRYELENGFNTENYKLDESEIYNEAIISAYENKCEMIFCEKGLTFTVGDCKIEFLSPGASEYSKDNNYSAVIMLTYKSKKFLFTGDIEEKVEKELISSYGSYLKADVLKIAHHGSGSSTSEEFLDYVKPEYAVISSSGHSSILPNYNIVERLQENNIEILATGNIGSFAIGIKEDKIVYSAASKPNNYLLVILAVFAFIVFIFWRIPIIKSNKRPKFKS